LRVLRDGERGVIQYRAWFGAGNEQTGLGIAAVRKAFAPDDETLTAENRQHDRASQANEYGVASGEMDAAGNGSGHFAIGSGFIVKSAVGFDVTEFEAGFAGGVTGEGYLGGDKIGDRGGVELLAEEGAAAEVFGIGVAGVGARAHLGGGCFAKGGARELRRAGMGAATDVGEVEVAEELTLGAGFEEGRGLAEIAIQEHGHPRWRQPSLRRW
jgi:hypothetical protein